MPREKETFRDQLMRLDERFPDKELLSKTDVAAYTGLNRKTCATKFDFDKRTNRISKTVLARALS